MKKVVIAGGSGFIGRALVKEFADAGYEVVVLSRSSKPVEGARTALWDGKALGPWQSELEGAHAVVNLCGASVVRRWTKAYIQEMYDSRIGPTALLGEAISTCGNPPACWINASGVGWYGDTGDREVSEGAPAATDGLGRLSTAWEGAMDEAATPRTRRVKVRIGFVLGRDGGAFVPLARATRFFLGGALGTGKQYVSWIHVRDVARMFVWASEATAVEGAINGTAPNPVTNATLMAEIREAYGRPFSPPVPVFVVRILSSIMGWPVSLMLGSQRVYPQIPIGNGFTYLFPTIDRALEDLVDVVPTAWRDNALA